MKPAVERIKALGRHELFVAVVVLAAVLALAFPEVVFGGKTPKAFYQQLLTLERGQGVRHVPNEYTALTAVGIVRIIVLILNWRCSRLSTCFHYGGMAFGSCVCGGSIVTKSGS